MMFQAWVKEIWIAEEKRTGVEFLQEGAETHHDGHPSQLILSN